MSKLNRRDFMKGTAAALGAGVLTRLAKGSGRSYAANDKIVIAQIGLGGRGQAVSRELTRRPDVEMAYCCDVDEKRGGGFPEQIESMQGYAPKRVNDMRRIFDDPDVDAVVVSTCDHWHGLATVWACQAGKDVYVEKPASHNIWEGRKMVEAARKYNRVVQTGTQNRSAPYNLEAREYIRSGALGKIHLVKVFGLEPGSPFHAPADSPQPDTVDYDMYLGPAPKRTFNRGHFHDGWKYYWNYCGGDISDDGVHQLDLALMLIERGLPRSVNCVGGNYAFDDDREVADTQVASYDYGDMILTFELSQWAQYMRKTTQEIRNTDQFPPWPLSATRIEIYGTEGRMTMGRHGGGWQAIGRTGEVEAQSYGRVPDREHQENFVDCIRTRKLPNADIEVGHRSAALVHMTNIAMRVGQRLAFDERSERFTNNDKANGMLKRSYREPYAIPEKV